MHNLLREDIVVLSAARTPVGRFDGILSGLDAIQLGAAAVEAAVARAGVAPEAVDTVNLGNVVPGGLGEAPAKAAAVRAGLSHAVHARTVETVCGSAMDAIVLAAESLLAGSAELAVAGGMESRSNAPYLLGPRFRRASGEYRRGERLRVRRGGAYRFVFTESPEEQLRATEIIDATTYDGLFWPAEKKFMRQYALDFAARRGYTAELVNRYAAESHRKATEAKAEGLFEDEIAAAGDVSADELMPEELLQRELRENPDDIASAYNSSTPADAAAALVLTTARLAEARGWRPAAKLLGYARVDGPASDFLAAPMKAAQELLSALKAAGCSDGLSIAEANEAFAMQLPLYEEALPGVDINLHGGAVALGHPLGAAGARIVTTLLYAMQRYRRRRGLAAMCYGGGGGYALAVESVG